MTHEVGKRRAEIIAFLDALTEHEKLVALAHLSNNPAVGARIPHLARAVLDADRAQRQAEVIKLASESSSLELEFLARQKGCRLVRVEGAGDRWRVVATGGTNAKAHAGGGKQPALTRNQALVLLRSLPERR
jgi:hypothetical protein